MTADDHLEDETSGEPGAATSPRRRLLSLVCFALAALGAVLPLILHGCSCGHDFDFHLLSWMEAANQWQHGILKPVWAFTSAYNAGEPRLLLYPPLSWATGGALGMVLPWSAVPVAFTWLVLFLCGVTMQRLLRRWTSPAVATLGGCLYLVNPYMLFCAYERSAYAELMAAAWMPLLLAAMLRPRISIWRITLVVSLLWITNAPAAIVGCYSIVLLGLLRLFFMRREGRRTMLNFAAKVTAGMLLAVLVDAFYMLPMAVERHYVQLNLAVVPLARPDANMLFQKHNNAFHDHVLQQSSWIGLGTIAAALLCGLFILLRNKRSHAAVRHYSSMHRRDTAQLNGGFDLRSGVPVMLAFSLIVLFLLSRWSTPVWHVAPELVFLQFPWRFLALQSAVSITLLALALRYGLAKARFALLVCSGVLIASLAGNLAGGRYFREECADNESVAAQRTAFLHEDGVDPTDEYTPTDADNDQLHLHLPPAWTAATPDGDPGPAQQPLRSERSGPEHIRFLTPRSSHDALLLVRLRAFPGWHALRDGEPVAFSTRPDGLMIVPLPAGAAHVVEVRYRITADQWAGMGVSAVTLLTLAGLRRRRRSGIMEHSA